MTIPYLGDRLLDALVGLLVRLHLAGFFWGDCSLSNTLFRRDAGHAAAYVIDVETSERHDHLTDGQRRLDLEIATENVAGGLLDLQAGGRLVADVDPCQVAENIETRYEALWDELTGIEEFAPDETWRVEQRVRRLHDLGFDVGEMEVVTDEDGQRLRLVPASSRAGTTRTGCSPSPVSGRGEPGPAAARRHPRLRRRAAQRTGTTPPENIAAVRWLDQRFEPVIAAIPPSLLGKLQAAELFHQLLEHRWFSSEEQGGDVPLEEAIESYVGDVLVGAPDEQVRLDPPTGELLLGDLSGPEPQAPTS